MIFVYSIYISLWAPQGLPFCKSTPVSSGTSRPSGVRTVWGPSQVFASLSLEFRVYDLGGAPTIAGPHDEDSTLFAPISCPPRFLALRRFGRKRPYLST